MSDIPYCLANKIGNSRNILHALGEEMRHNDSSEMPLDCYKSIGQFRAFRNSRMTQQKEIIMSSNDEIHGMSELREFVAEHQERITRTRLSAMTRVENVAEALTDLDAVGAEATRQKLEGIIFATPTILPPYMGEAFRTEFSEVADELRDALSRTSTDIVNENPQQWIDLMIQKFEEERQDNNVTE